jgi:hypothetical protein
MKISLDLYRCLSNLNRVFELITACDGNDADNGDDDGDGAALPR